MATASHELRSPLTSIKGFAELLERSDGLSEREREFAEVILSSTDRLVELVDDLLDVARLEAGRDGGASRACSTWAELVREVARADGAAAGRPQPAAWSSTCRPACRARWPTRATCARS